MDGYATSSVLGRRLEVDRLTSGDPTVIRIDTQLVRRRNRQTVFRFSRYGRDLIITRDCDLGSCTSVQELDATIRLTCMHGTGKLPPHRTGPLAVIPTMRIYPPPWVGVLGGQ